MKNWNLKKILPFILLAGILFAIPTGCILVDDDGEQQETTLGAELIDLKKALDAGAISKEEYIEEKAKLLNQELR